MKEIKKSREFDIIDHYTLVLSREAKRLKDIEGTVVITDFIEYEEEKDTGEVVDVLSLLTNNGEVFKGLSPTFKRSFYRILELTNGCPVPIKIVCGKAKSNGDYIDCVLDVAAYRNLTGAAV